MPLSTKKGHSSLLLIETTFTCLGNLIARIPFLRHKAAEFGRGCELRVSVIGLSTGCLRDASFHSRELDLLDF